MSSASPAPATFSPPTPPMLVRSHSLHSLNTSPLFPQLAPHEAQWHHDVLAQQYDPYAIPFDQAFSGQSFLLGNASHGMRVFDSPMVGASVAYGAYPPMHIHPQQNASHANQMAHRVPASHNVPRAHMHSSPLMYYTGGRDPRRPPSNLPGPWSGTREVVLRSPPLPRQRSAKACERCRGRKTKCSGGLPCNRCETRGFECSYVDGAPKGPSKARASTRRRIAARTVSFAESSADESTPEASRPDTPTETTPEASGSSNQPERIPSVMRPSTLPSLRIQTSLPAAPVVGSASSTDGGFVPFAANSPALADGTLAPGAEMTDAQTSSMIQGYTIPSDQECATRAQANANGIWGQHQTPEHELSDHSRPGSSSSASSYCSTNASGYSQSSETSVRTSVDSMVWPSPMVEFAFPPPTAAPPLSTRSSSSSLEGALIEKPPRSATLPTSPAEAQAPIAGDNPTPSGELTTALSDILSQSHISETAVQTASGAHGSPAPSPLAPLSAGWSPESPAGALRFEDVFNIPAASPSSTVARMAPPMASGLGTPLNVFQFDGDFVHAASGTSSLFGPAIVA